MSLLDRHWWLGIATATLFVVAGVVFILWYVAYALPLDVPGAPNAVADWLTAADIAFVCVGAAIGFGVSALRARERAELRRAAIDGNPTAVPLATDAVAALNVAPERLEQIDAKWRGAWRGALGTTFSVVFLGAAFLYILVQAVLPVLFDVIRKSISPSAYALNSSDLHASLVFLLWVGTLPAIGVIVLAEQLEPFAFLFSRITVRADGIFRYRFIGRPRQMRWHEARLLEVSRFPYVLNTYRAEHGHSRYILYSEGTRIYWTAASSESERAFPRLALVAPAVTHYTGLQSRTFDSALVAPGELVRSELLQDQNQTPRDSRIISFAAGAVGFVALALDPTSPIRVFAAAFACFLTGMLIADIKRMRSTSA